MSREFFAGWLAGFKKVGHSFTTITNAVFLTLAYVIGIGPTSVIARLARKRFLDTTLDSVQQSYWCDHELKTEPIEKYERQF